MSMATSTSEKGKEMKFKKSLLVFLFSIVLMGVAAPVGISHAASNEQTVASAEMAEATTISGKAIAAGIAIAVAAGAGALGMGIAVAKSVEGISRQPEAHSKIQTVLMLGLVFVETAIIYALIVAILIIFVL